MFNAIVFNVYMNVLYCSRVIKTKQELEVLRYVNRISSEAHKKVPRDNVTACDVVVSL